MSFCMRPEISSERLERLLSCLPEPTYAEVSLFGDFDYSDVSRQAKEIVKGIALQTNKGLTFNL